MVIAAESLVLTEQAARAWLERRGWIVEYVTPVEYRDHWAVGHTHLGVFNVWGRGKTIIDAVIDAMGRLERHGRDWR